MLRPRARRPDKMPKKKPRRGQAPGRGVENSLSQPVDSTRAPARNQPPSTPSPQIDLVGFRERLVDARRRLVERIADDFPPDRRFPDSGWTRMLADIQIAIAAVDDVIAEGAP